MSPDVQETDQGRDRNLGLSSTYAVSERERGGRRKDSGRIVSRRFPLLGYLSD